MAEKAVSREQAEAVVFQINQKWPADEFSHLDGPYLYPHDHEEMPEGCWSIAWEGAPEDWAFTASMEIKVPGVHLEAMYSWCLGLYPA